jgi:hypothetical protein
MNDYDYNNMMLKKDSYSEKILTIETMILIIVIYKNNISRKVVLCQEHTPSFLKNFGKKESKIKL